LPLLFALTPDRPLREVAADAEVDVSVALTTVRRLCELGLIERREPCAISSAPTG
jgi:hypothetical protein